MEAKKKKILIIVLIAVLVAVIATIGIVFAVKNINNKKGNVNNNTSNSNFYTSILTNVDNEAILEQLVSKDYDGTYKYSHIASLEFNLQEYSEEKQEAYKANIYKQFDANNIDEFFNVLNQNKLKYKDSETLEFHLSQFSNGKEYGSYTRSFNNKSTQTGFYYGDKNLTKVILNNESSEKISSFYISTTYTVPSSAIKPQANQTSLNSNDGTYIYIFKNFVSKSNPDRIFFTVTYAYKLVEFEKTIPSDELEIDQGNDII